MANSSRVRIKQLEHRIKEMSAKCKRYDKMHKSLVTVVQLYESRCMQDGWSKEQLKSLRCRLLVDLIGDN